MSNIKERAEEYFLDELTQAMGETIEGNLIRDLLTELTTMEKELERAEKVIDLTVKDLRMRGSEEGVIDISGFIWSQLTDIANYKGDKG